MSPPSLKFLALFLKREPDPAAAPPAPPLDSTTFFPLAFFTYNGTTKAWSDQLKEDTESEQERVSATQTAFQLAWAEHNSNISIALNIQSLLPMRNLP